MIPVIGSPNWHFMPLPPTKFAPAKIARVRVVNGCIVSAFSREKYVNAPGLPARRLHWAADIGSWTEAA